MTAALFPYQEEGARRLAERSKLYLGDDVGLGKTRTVLRGLQLAGVTDAVVLCPAVVRQHWHDEAAALEYHGRLTVLSYQKFVLSPEILTAGHMGWGALILDEAHYLKRPESKRTELIMGPGGIHEAFDRVWPVSGTPMPRNPMELHPVLAALWPKRLQALGVLRPGAWLNRYCLWRAGEYGPRIYGARPEALMELKELLALVMLRRRAVDVAPEMPPASWGTVTVEAEDLASLPYLNAETAAALERGELPPMDANLARYLHAVGDLKAPYVAQLIGEELENDLQAKRVIFAHHRSALALLAQGLSAHGVVTVDGSVPEEQRRERVKVFQTHPTCRVFLGQIEACATGMDGLQRAGCHDIAILEPSWASDRNVQAAGRVARLGQPLPVRARMFALAGTVDRAVVRNHHHEAAMRRGVLDAST